MRDKIKVLHVFKTALPASYGGVEVLIDTLCNEVAGYGVDSAILSLAKQPSRKPISVGSYKVYEARQNFFLASTGFSFSAFFMFKSLLKDFDIVHYHFPNPFADMLHFACRVKKPSVVTYHSDIVKQRNLLKLYRPLMNKFFQSVDRVAATSPNYVATSEVLQRWRDKVVVIPIGVNQGKSLKPDAKRLKYWRARLPQPFFLFIGALRYYKGLHVALDAIKGADINLAVVGAGGIEDQLRQQAKQNNLDNVHFLGSVSDEDKAALLHLCYGFVFPSHIRTEAFGIALLEAASHGKPLISCEIGTGTTYVNIHKKTGLVVAPGSVDELRQAMLYLLANPQKAALFGKNARARSKKLFTATKQGSAYYKLYQELLGA